MHLWKFSFHISRLSCFFFLPVYLQVKHVGCHGSPVLLSCSWKNKRWTNKNTTDLKQKWLWALKWQKNKAFQVFFLASLLTYFTELNEHMNPSAIVMYNNNHDLLQKTDEKLEESRSFIHRLYGFRTLRTPDVSRTPAADYSCIDLPIAAR